MVAARAGRSWDVTGDEADADERRKLVGNERIKLAATFMNNIAAAFAIGGGIAPTIATAYGAAQPTGRYAFAFLMLWVAAAAVAHLAGRFLLGKLEP